MAEEQDFDRISGKISEMERSLVPFSKFSGKVSLKLGVKVSPSEYSYLSYDELLNYYDRINKIKRTSELVRGVGGAAPRKTKEIEEAETAIKEISKQPSALEVIGEISAPIMEEEETALPLIRKPGISKVPAEEPEAPEFEEKEFDVPDIDIEFEKPKIKEEIQEPEIEFEEKPAPKKIISKIKFEKVKKTQKEKQMEFEVPEPDIGFEESEETEAPEIHMEEPRKKEISPIVFESAIKEKKKLEEKREIAEKAGIKPVLLEEEETGEIPYLSDHEIPHVAKFPSIEQNTETIALNKFKEIHAKIEATPGTLSKEHIKVQMLQLTKQLFREKMTSEREIIKKEIIRLKNLLSSGGKIQKMSFKTLLETIPDEFNSEIKEYTSALSNITVDSINESKALFYSSIKQIEEEHRKKAFELFFSDLDSLDKQASELSEKSSEFLANVHSSVLSHIKKESPAAEGKTCTNLISEISKEYSEKFNNNLKYIKEYITLIKLKAMHDSGTVQKSDLKPLFEALELPEEQLLHYLQSNHPKKYGLYLKKNLSKIEALSNARRIYAKEKGLSNELVDKYFVSG